MFAAILLAQVPALRAAPVELSADTAVATAGFFQLRWQARGAVLIEEDTEREFTSPRVIYRGADNARVLSGKPDGRWYYRARTAGSGGAFGEVLEVTVRHHPIERAFAFFALGALVFLATLGVIIRGARST
ncbi:MAG TPA: fibronectin type III domain-containing protein [Woeseiaceae bacterium]|nr:fibronectin type III domain-containing protein [Woeseiaceae bacterium]